MIKEFQGRYRFLSNFWRVIIELDGVLLPTVEHAYVVRKIGAVEEFLAATGMTLEYFTKLPPGGTKRLGRGVELRPDWEDVKLEVMRDLLQLKFSQPRMRRLLRATGQQHIQEGNYWHDKYWGVCYCRVCKSRGLNMLGKLLMQERDRSD